MFTAEIANAITEEEEMIGIMRMMKMKTMIKMKNKNKDENDEIVSSRPT